MKKIGVNWIKMTLAVTIAIELAILLNLEFSISAGIIAILTIQPTKKETIRTAIGRLIAFVVALIISFVCFYMLGVTKTAFLIYISIYILVCHIFKWNNAITINSVLVSHFVTAGAMGLPHIINEVLIFGIGVGIGILANLHLHKKVNYMEEMKKATDQQIIKILNRMAERIINKELSDYNGDCFKILEKLLRKSKNIAEENYNNQFGKSDIFDIEYLAMRERQEFEDRARLFNLMRKIEEFIYIKMEFYQKVQIKEAYTKNKKYSVWFM